MTDLTKDTRKYTETYALNSATGVKAILRDRHRIAARRFKGDTAASDILIDLHSAIESAGLTERQAEAVALVYGLDVTIAKASEVMCTSEYAIDALLDEATALMSAWCERKGKAEATV